MGANKDERFKAAQYLANLRVSSQKALHFPNIFCIAFTQSHRGKGKVEVLG